MQLGLPYGRQRSGTVMSGHDALRILDAAWDLGIRAFDTAEAYGLSASRLREWIDSRGHAEALEVVTKCGVNPALTPVELAENANNALSRFNGIGRVVLLSHGPVAGERWPAMLAVVRDHRAEAGQSVYTPDEVRAACELAGVRRIQAPGNVLDRRAVHAVQDTRVSLDVRSIYLQGVLLEKPEQAEMRAPGSGRFVAALRSAAASLEIDLASLLIAAMLRTIRPGDRLVLGVDTATELESLPRAFGIPDETVLEFLKCIEPFAGDPGLDRFIDPRSWTPRLVR